MRKLAVAVVLAFAVLATAGCTPVAVTFTLESAGVHNSVTAVPAGITPRVLS
jgi:hypothetical protein